MVKIGATDTSQKFDSKVIGGFNTSQDSFSMMYGMTAEEAYQKLMGEANMKMNLGADGSGNGVDVTGVEDSLNSINNYFDEANASQQELISGSDFFKTQMEIAERQGATQRTPAASALGGGTMSTQDIASQTSAIKSPLGVSGSQQYKAGQGGK